MQPFHLHSNKHVDQCLARPGASTACTDEQRSCDDSLDGFSVDLAKFVEIAENDDEQGFFAFCHDDESNNLLGASFVVPDNTYKHSPSEMELRKATTARKMEALLSWYDRLNEWLDYVCNEGYGVNPQSLPKTADGKLSNWVNKNREQMKKFVAGETTSYMHKGRLELLEQVGFRWGQTKEKFDDKHSKLLEFRRIVGHADVPTKPVDKHKGSPLCQVGVRVDKLVGEREVGFHDRKILIDLLLDSAFCRWVTDMRARFKKSTDAKKWKLRKHSLVKTEFRFSKQKRTRAY